MEIYIYGKIKAKTKIMRSEDGYHHLIQHQALTPRHFLQWRGGTNNKISTPEIVSTIGQLPTPMITNSEIDLFHQTQVVLPNINMYFYFDKSKIWWFMKEIL